MMKRWVASRGVIGALLLCSVLPALGQSPGTSPLSIPKGGTGSASASAARTSLGLAIGANVQAYNANLAAIAGATTAADKLWYWSGSGAGALIDFKSWARSFAAAADASAGRTSLGVAIGTNVQAWDADLDCIAALSTAGLIKRTGSGTCAIVSDSAGLSGSLSDETGSGAAVFAVSPALTGTPTAPTASGGTNTTQIATTAFVQSAVVASTTGVSSIAGNTGAFTLANGIDNSTNQIQLTAARRTLPTVQVLTSGTAATYTTPANALWIEVYICGAGGSGTGVTNTGAGSFVAGNAGGDTTFSSIVAKGGNGGSASSAGAVGGTGGTGSATWRQPGGAGAGTIAANSVASGAGGKGGDGMCGGGAQGPAGGANNNGNSAGANSGAGGSGATGGGTNFVSGPGGGAGEFVYLLIPSPSGSYTYTITAGGTGTGGSETSGAGGSGVIRVVEHYGS